MKALLWMAGSILSFCLMAVGARQLSGSLSVFEVLFARSVIGLVVVTLVILASGRHSYFNSARLGLHGFRNVVHFAGQYGWFFAIGILPLAEVFALEFTVPIWTAMIAALFLGEHISKRKMAAIACGIAGVLVIVQPGVAIIDVASLAVLAAAICYAVVHSTTKVMAKTEHPLTILFYMCVVQLPLGLGFALPDWQWPELWQYGWLLVVGISALTAHLCLTKAMALMEVTKVVTIDFLRLPSIALIGVLFYDEYLEWTLIVGGLLMLAGNLFNVPIRKRIPA